MLPMVPCKNMVEACTEISKNAKGNERCLNLARVGSGIRAHELNGSERNMDIPEIFGEENIREAARRAVQHDGIIAVGLFGSRARGTNREDSDWDICVIGTRKPDDLWECFGLETTEECVDLSWLGIDKIRDGARFGEFSGEVVRDWKTLAGDDTPVRDLEIKPMSAQMLAKHIAMNLPGNVAIGCRELIRSRDTRWIARRTEAPEDKKIKLETAEIAHGIAMRASADAAMALYKGIVGSLGFDSANRHGVQRNESRNRTGGKGVITRDQRSMIENPSRVIDEANDLVIKYRGTPCGTAEESEPFNRTQVRTIKVMELHRTAMEGILEGKGILSGLRQAMAEPRQTGEMKKTPAWGVIHDAWVRSARNAIAEADHSEMYWARRSAGAAGIDRRLYDEYKRWRETAIRLKSVPRKGPNDATE